MMKRVFAALRAALTATAHDAGSSIENRQYSGERVPSSTEELAVSKQDPNSTGACDGSTVAGPEWSYSVHRDEIRGSEMQMATLASTESVELAFPYNGGTYAQLVLRWSPQWGEEALFTLNPGQIDHAPGQFPIAVKFDTAPVGTVLVSDPENGSVGVLFVAMAPRFIKQVKKSSRLMIELPFYGDGTRQFTFELYGLEWPRY
ncbi:hypothetical protein A9R05_01185 [Burkholderia sp. KK1]|nr:hypothetical protein A9R05_01185 [Burkholderia sp. KK1]